MAERPFDLLVEDVVHVLAEALDLHRDANGEWWANDWMDKVDLTRDEAEALAIVLRYPSPPKGDESG